LRTCATHCWTLCALRRLLHGTDSRGGAAQPSGTGVRVYHGLLVSPHSVGQAGALVPAEAESHPMPPDWKRFKYPTVTNI
jgi:hypothetical protein